MTKQKATSLGDCFLLFEDLDEGFEWAVLTLLFGSEDRLQPAVESERPDEDLHEIENLPLGMRPTIFNIPLTLSPPDGLEVALDVICHIFVLKIESYR